jgi:hypothetical protein
VDDLTFAEALSCNLPKYLILTAGIAWALARYDRHPHASLWAMLGFGWLIAFSIVSVVWQTLLVVELFPDEAGSTLEIACNLTLSALEGFGYVYLLFAIVADRAADRQRYFQEDPHDDH